MNIHELRIWNYVLFCKAESIITSINNNDEENPYVDLASYDNIPIEDLHPIPLTEEWFMKFGFEKEIDEFDIFSIHNSQYSIQHYKNGKCIFVYSPINELNSEDEENVIFLQIKHVHQLQNLYFALTGEELTIK